MSQGSIEEFVFDGVLVKVSNYPTEDEFLTAWAALWRSRSAYARESSMSHPDLSVRVPACLPDAKKWFESASNSLPKGESVIGEYRIFLS